MNQIYRSIGITRQGFHQRMDRWLRRQEQDQGVLAIIREVRQDHQRMSVVKIYHRMKPQGLGLRRFTQIAREYGLMIDRKRNRRRTTDSSGVERFANLVSEKELTGLNQVWVSDITYIEVAEQFYYLTLVMDAYSRRILGYEVSKRLLTIQTTIPALKKALRLRGINNYHKALIFHSDGGGQYFSRAFCKLTEKRGILNSMGKTAYENAKAERVIGTLKHEYLNHVHIRNYRVLKKEVTKTVDLYNTERPHQMLDYKTPTEFELSTYPHKFTKEKRSKKENINNNSNVLTRKTVNAFCT